MEKYTKESATKIAILTEGTKPDIATRKVKTGAVKPKAAIANCKRLAKPGFALDWERSAGLSIKETEREILNEMLSGTE